MASDLHQHGVQVPELPNELLEHKATVEEYVDKRIQCFLGHLIQRLQYSSVLDLKSILQTSQECLHPPAPTVTAAALAIPSAPGPVADVSNGYSCPVAAATPGPAPAPASSPISYAMASPSSLQLNGTARPPVDLHHHLELRLSHDCRCSACSDETCPLCETNPSRPCREQLKSKYLIKYRELSPKGEPLSIDKLEQCILPDQQKLLQFKGRSGGVDRSTLSSGYTITLEGGCATLSDLCMMASSEALIGKEACFRLMVCPVDAKGTRAPSMLCFVSEPFAVATTRLRHAVKSDVPLLTEDVKKLEHIGRKTIQKLCDLQSANVQLPYEAAELKCIKTVGELKSLFAYCEDNIEFGKQVMKALKLNSAKWQRLHSHVNKAVAADFRPRVWWCPDGQRGLLFPCHTGQIKLQAPVAWINRGVVMGQDDQVLWANQLPPELSLLVPGFQLQALRDWFAPAHGNWKIYWPEDMPSTMAVVRAISHEEYEQWKVASASMSANVESDTDMSPRAQLMGAFPMVQWGSRVSSESSPVSGHSLSCLAPQPPMKLEKGSVNLFKDPAVAAAAAAATAAGMASAPAMSSLSPPLPHTPAFFARSPQAAPVPAYIPLAATSAPPFNPHTMYAPTSQGAQVHTVSATDPGQPLTTMQPFLQPAQAQPFSSPLAAPSIGSAPAPPPLPPATLLLMGRAQAQPFPALNQIHLPFVSCQVQSRPPEARVAQVNGPAQGQQFPPAAQASHSSTSTQMQMPLEARQGPFAEALAQPAPSQWDQECWSPELVNQLLQVMPLDQFGTITASVCNAANTPGDLKATRDTNNLVDWETGRSRCLDPLLLGDASKPLQRTRSFSGLLNSSDTSALVRQLQQVDPKQLQKVQQDLLNMQWPGQHDMQANPTPAPQPPPSQHQSPEQQEQSRLRVPHLPCLPQLHAHAALIQAAVKDDFRDSVCVDEDVEDWPQEGALPTGTGVFATYMRSLIQKDAIAASSSTQGMQEGHSQEQALALPSVMTLDSSLIGELDLGQMLQGIHSMSVSGTIDLPELK